VIRSIALIALAALVTPNPSSSAQTPTGNITWIDCGGEVGGLQMPPGPFCGVGGAPGMDCSMAEVYAFGDAIQQIANAILTGPASHYACDFLSCTNDDPLCNRTGGFNINSTWFMERTCIGGLASVQISFPSDSTAGAFGCEECE